MILAADDGTNVAVLDAKKSSIGEEVDFPGYENNKAQVTFDDFKNIKMIVKEGKVLYENLVLKTNKEEILVTGVKDGALVG